MAESPNKPKASEAIEPGAAKRPAPVWIFIALLLLLYGSMVYFDQASGWFSQQIYAPYHNLAELEKWQPAISHGAFEIGRAVYNKPTCVACHQADGKGTPGQFPSLLKSEWVNEPEPGRLIRIVLNGLSGPLEFQGQNYNGSMVPWKDVLNDEEVAAVLTYVRQNKEWGNNAPEVKPEQVKAIRDKIKDRPTPFSPDEVLKINPAE
jgi:mono/diheme cytochrome c family protein